MNLPVRETAKYCCLVDRQVLGYRVGVHEPKNDVETPVTIYLLLDDNQCVEITMQPRDVSNIGVLHLDEGDWKAMSKLKQMIEVTATGSGSAIRVKTADESISCQTVKQCEELIKEKGLQHYLFLRVNGRTSGYHHWVKKTMRALDEGGFFAAGQKPYDDRELWKTMSVSGLGPEEPFAGMFTGGPIEVCKPEEGADYLTRPSDAAFPVRQLDHILLSAIDVLGDEEKTNAACQAMKSRDTLKVAEISNSGGFELTAARGLVQSKNRDKMIQKILKKAGRRYPPTVQALEMTRSFEDKPQAFLVLALAAFIALSGPAVLEQGDDVMMKTTRRTTL